MTHHPRKRFGQHFLHDPVIICKIVAAVAPRRGECVVEIGPGHGAITVPLLNRLGSLHVVELDRDLIPELRERCRESGELVAHQADALKFDFRSLSRGNRSLRVVGNLPYNISTPLLFRLLDQRECVQDMHLMLQREVVKRMTAAPRSKAYGRLSVMLAARSRVEALFDIGPGAFRPPPRVSSSFVRLIPRDRPPFPLTDPEAFARVVAQAFSMRRKTLRNALRPLLDGGDIRAAGIDPGARPEMLAPAEFAALANRIVERGKS